MEGLLLGALLGVLLERATSMLGAVLITLRYWSLRGTYGIWPPEGPRAGSVTIRPRLGNRFLTRGTHGTSSYDWTGSFLLDDLYMGSGHGFFRHDDSEHRVRPAWGNHSVMVVGDGTIAVQWLNVSHAEDRKGGVLWKRETRRVGRRGLPHELPKDATDETAG